MSAGECVVLQGVASIRDVVLPRCHTPPTQHGACRSTVLSVNELQVGGPRIAQDLDVTERTGHDPNQPVERPDERVVIHGGVEDENALQGLGRSEDGGVGEAGVLDDDGCPVSSGKLDQYVLQGARRHGQRGIGTPWLGRNDHIAHVGVLDLDRYVVELDVDFIEDGVSSNRELKGPVRSRYRRDGASRTESPPTES